MVFFLPEGFEDVRFGMLSVFDLCTNNKSRRL